MAVTLPPLPLPPVTPCGGSEPIPPFPPVPPDPLPIPTEKGNLLYVSSNHGIAACFNAYGTDGTDGTPTWYAITHSAPVAGTGTISQTGYTVTGSGTAFTSEVHVGDLIVGTGLRGMVTVIASDVSLTLDTSASAGSTSYTISPLLDGLTLDSFPVRGMKFDPCSIDARTSAYSKIWANLNDGLYFCTGLPNAPTWTRVLSLAGVATLLGCLESNARIGYSFSPSKILQDFVCIAIAEREVDTVHCRWYFAYTPDGGATWYATTDYWRSLDGGAFDPDQFKVFASEHIAGTYYMYGAANEGDWIGFTNPVVGYWRSTTLPTFERLASAADGVGYDYKGRTVFPYRNTSGAVYADDNCLYETCEQWWSGVNAIRRAVSAFSPAWSTGYTIPTRTNQGDVSMLVNVPATGAQIPLLIDSANENNQVAFALSNCNQIGFGLWVSTDGAMVWSQRGTPSIGGRTISDPRDMAMIPADYNILYSVSVALSGGVAVPMFSTDFGDTTWKDISNYGLANALDDVLALGSGHFNNALILVDDNYLDGLPSEVTGSGVDVSHYQGAINWATTKTAGIAFAFMKATQGATYTDPTFATNWAGAGAQSIQRGAYHYFMNGIDPTTQANHFVAIATSAGELGYVVDCEDESTTLDPTNLKTFLDRVETLTGRKCIIYTRAGWWNPRVGFQGWASQYPLWVAHWNATTPTLPQGWTEYAFWQYTSMGQGSTYGASGFIDLDKAAGGVL